MARHIAADGLELFRAVVTTTRTREGEEPTVYTSYFGPYNKVGTAKAQVTSEQRSAAFSNRHNVLMQRRRDASWKPTVTTVTGHVEKANVTWGPVT